MLSSCHSLVTHPVSSRVDPETTVVLADLGVGCVEKAWKHFSDACEKLNKDKYILDSLRSQLCICGFEALVHQCCLLTLQSCYAMKLPFRVTHAVCINGVDPETSIG